MQAYSNPKRESDPHSLPDIEVFQLTAEEAVTQDEDLMWEASKEFPLMHMNSRDRDKAIEWAIEESGCTGGWFWWSCLPGCLPDGPAIGPFKTEAEALADARDGLEDEDTEDEESPTVCDRCGHQESEHEASGPCNVRSSQEHCICYAFKRRQ